VRSVKKSCVHIVHAQDLRLIPFDTYNPRMPFPRNPFKSA
jgi:hypothetical protein